MPTACFLAAALLIAVVLAGRGSAARTWLLALAVLAMVTLVQTGITRATVIAVAVSAMLVLLLQPTRLRRALIAAPVMRAFRRRMPPMSASERVALAAGTVWWDGELLAGDPDWRRLRALPPTTFTPEERAFLDGPATELCAMIDEWSVTRETHDLPPVVWDHLRAHRFFGLIIPREYGGHGFSAAAHSAVIQKLTSRSFTAAVTVMVPNALGPAELLLRYGTDAQRARWLPRLASGEDIPCFALTGPDAGSDAASIPDHGVVCYGTWEGREHVLGMRLNWEKRYITLAPVATVLGVAFRLHDPDHLLGAEDDLGITLALVPVATAGVAVGRRHRPMDAAFMNGPTQGRDVFVPLDAVIGGAERVGQGWTMLMNCLAAGRGISLPANACGVAQAAAAASGAYARVRRQFGVPLTRFEAIEGLLGRMAGTLYAMEATRRITLQALDAGEHPAVVSAMVKTVLTDRARAVVTDAMDLHAGKAICLGPSNYLALAWQQVPIAITVEGANLLLRSFVVFGQGVLRGHPWLRHEIEACEESDEGALRRFDGALFGHVAFFARNAVRTAAGAVLGGRVPRDVPRRERRYYRRLNRYAAALAFSADVALLTQGGALKRREKLTARLADAMSELYVASALLKHHADGGWRDDERPLLDWAFDVSCARIEEAYAAFYANLRPRFLARCARALVFPWGSGRSAGPNDVQEQQAARCLTEPGDVRDRLLDGLHVPPADERGLGRVLAAWRATLAIEPLLARWRAAGIDARREAAVVAAVGDGRASTAELVQWRSYREAYRAAIQVDDFASDLDPASAAYSTEPVGAPVTTTEPA